MADPEAMEDVQLGAKRPALDIESLKSKKFKADDLPLSSAQHASIDKLLLSFKKKGGFDSIRKKIWADFNDGESKIKFTDELFALAESEIEREPALLSRERGKAATLIEGAVDRSDVYKNAELSIDTLASNHLQSILDSVREIRRLEIGDEAATKEEEAGNKTDADYEAHVRAKREEREKVWREEMRKQKEIDDEQKRIRDEERRKKRELERKKEEEELARRKEIDDQRRAEREREREEQRAIDDREREERRERRRREDRDRYRDYDRFNDWSPAYRSDRGVSRNRDTKREKSAVSKDATPAPAGPVDEESLEEAALKLLLKEGEELAAKARQKPDFDFEKAEALESGLKPDNKTGDSKLGNALTRTTSPSRDSRPRDSIPDRRDRTRHHTRDRSRSRSRRRGSRYSPDRRRDRSRDASVRSRDERRGFRDFRDSRDDRSYRPSHLDHVPNPGTETLTAVATEAETVIVTVMIIAPAAGLLHADVHVLDLDLVNVFPENHALVLGLPARDEGHDPDVPHALDALLPPDGPLLLGKPHLHLISTVMCRRLATEANHPVVEPAPRIANKDRDLAKLIATFLALSERLAKKERPNLQQSRLKTRMTELLVGGVVVDEEAQADVEVVPVDEAVLADEAELCMYD
ncbi:hypothetical protein N7513_004103 [Penicillium frequentans]|nr:hypothetical protein N7513_004103 [Penicillium glabrum]